MTNSSALVCDGCGQIASGEHISRRLQRLEWTTRYRPVHISTLFLGAYSPRDEKAFLYAPGGEFQGEASLLLDAVGISPAGKGADAVHTEFQRAGFFLTHVLECPIESEASRDTNLQAALKSRMAAVATRIRRSLKPKRVMAITEALTPVLEDMLMLDLGSTLLLDNGKPFQLVNSAGENGMKRFREVLAGASRD
jgi:hypothetical protein